MTRIISRTPVRISFFGGGTDYPSYYSRYPGSVLGTSINKYTYVNLNTLSPFFDYNLRISYSSVELVKTLEEIKHPSVRACLKHREIFPPLDIHISADLPAKTGLGSSSSFTVGFLNALYAMEGKKIARQQLAEEACHIEQSVIKENVGSQDQFHAAFGGLNVIEFSGSSIRVRPVVATQQKKEMLQKHLLIFYTGITRFASKIAQEQIEKTQKKTNDSYLHQMKEMVSHAEEIISGCSLDHLPKQFGKLLHESWLLKKQLSSQISTDKIDFFYNKALQCGAHGGKLCGAGSGGFLAIIAPLETHEEIRSSLASLLEVPFQFEDEGSTIIYMKD